MTGAGVVVSGSGVVNGAAVGVGVGGGWAGDVPGGTGVGISVSIVFCNAYPSFMKKNQCTTTYLRSRIRLQCFGRSLGSQPRISETVTC